MAELATISERLAPLLPVRQDEAIRIFTRNRAAAQTIIHPEVPLRQEIFGQIYEAVCALQSWHKHVELLWRLVGAASEGSGLVGPPRRAKCVVMLLFLQTKLVQHLASGSARMLNATRGSQTALSEPHTQTLYDSLTRKQAGALVQLRTGMAKLQRMSSLEWRNIDRALRLSRAQKKEKKKDKTGTVSTGRVTLAWLIVDRTASMSTIRLFKSVGPFRPRKARLSRMVSVWPSMPER